MAAPRLYPLEARLTRPCDNSAAVSKTALSLEAEAASDDWASASITDRSLAAFVQSRLIAKYGVRPELAELVALHAGLGGAR